MSHSAVNSADYLAVMLHPESRKKVMARSVKAAKTLPEFDSVVFTGNSGALFGPELAGRLGKQMLLVNKPGVNRHCTLEVEGALNLGRWIFADDLISSGDTFFRVLKAVEKKRPGSIFIGAVLYTYDIDAKADPGYRMRTVYDYSAPTDSGVCPGRTFPVASAYLGKRGRDLSWKLKDRIFLCTWAAGFSLMT